MAKLKCAIIGSGNIGTDLMIKVIRTSRHISCRHGGHDPQSDGLRASSNVATTHDGRWPQALPDYRDVASCSTPLAGRPREPSARCADGKVLVGHARRHRRSWYRQSISTPISMRPTSTW